MGMECLSVVGKSNCPLFMRNLMKRNAEEDVQYHYLVHIALDVIEERAQTGSTYSDAYLGLLYNMDNFYVYGYMTNTRIKFILVGQFADSPPPKDMEVQTYFKQIHDAYLMLACNPFHTMDDMQRIRSDRFVSAIDHIPFAV